MGSDYIQYAFVSHWKGIGNHYSLLVSDKKGFAISSNEIWSHISWEMKRKHENPNKCYENFCPIMRSSTSYLTWPLWFFREK